MRLAGDAIRSRWFCFLVLLVLLFAGLVLVDRRAPSGRGIVKIQGVDPACYFGIAHSILFHHDFNLTDGLQVFPPSPSRWTVRVPATGLPGSPFAVGFSLLEVPFLAAGTALDALTGHPANGYSRFALLFYFFANLAFSLAGLFLLLELMLQVFGDHPASHKLIITFAVVATFAGTSLLVYSFSPMSHAATFLCATALLLVWYRIRNSYSIPAWSLLGLIAGLLAITRWQDGLFLLGLLLFDLFHWKRHLDAWKSWLLSRAAFLMVFCLCWIPQCLEWKAIYGRYLTIPQGDGFLAWPPSHFFHVLFSTSHGWFVWTPLTMIGFAGLLYGACKRKDQFVPWLSVLLAEIVVMGAQPTNWDGSDSFSIRSLTSCLPIICLGLGALFIWPVKWVRVGCMAVASLCVLDAMIFALQYRLDMVPRKGTLTGAELFTDKLYLRRALARRSAHQEALQLMAAGHSQEAAAVAEQAISRYHEDRFLLADIEQASRTQEDKAAAHQRLQDLFSRRLF